MLQPKNETEDLLFSRTKKRETLLKQTKTRNLETLKIELTEPRETLPINLPIIPGPDSNWMLGLSSLEVYNTIFNTTEENHKFELYTDTFDIYNMKQ